MPAQPAYAMAGPSCFDRMKTGFVMGCVIGMTIGGLFGGFSAYGRGIRGQELIKLSAKTMLQVGGSFGTFMTIGVGLRC